METALRWWVGLDWGTKRHAVCVHDGTGTLIAQRTIAHEPEAVAALLAWLEELSGGELAAVGIAIESSRGPLVETLLAAGCQVFTVTPQQVVRMRAQFSAEGAKDDRRDATVLATLLRILPGRCRRVVSPPAAVIVLQGYTRLVEELTAERTRGLLRLRAELARYYPQFLRVAPDLGRPWVLSLWELVPEPSLAASTPVEAVAEVLRVGRARQVAATLLAALRGPGFTVAAGVVLAARMRITAFLARLRLIHDQLRTARAQLPAATVAAAEALGIRNDPAVLVSVPGLGRLGIATLLAEAGPLLTARDYPRLRLECGLGPVTVQSGQSRYVRRRCAHNRRLAGVLYHLARVAMVHDGHWRARYRSLRARGHRHARALRTLGDRLLAVLCAMLRTQTLYDPAVRRVAA
jgi:transposase